LHTAGHTQPQLLECRYELALWRGITTTDEHSMLTSDAQLHLKLVQYHLKTLPGTTLSHDTKNGVMPTFHESYPSSKLIQTQQSTIWWMNTCPWHGGITTLRLHSSTMLGACLLLSHGAIYSRNPTSCRWRSDDTITSWSRGPAEMCTIKGDDLTPISRRPLSLVHQ
jgi:hypothetical protein